MSQPQNHETPRHATQDANSFSAVELLIILAKHKRLIFGFPIVIAVLCAAISLILPNIYRSSAKLLPPQQPQSNAVAMLSQLGGVAGIAAAAGALKNPNDLYVAMLNSRTVADRLVAQFDLKKIYETESLESARRQLAENTNISSGKDGLIEIEVEDKDQKLVANLANAYISELLKLTRSLAVTEASQRRMFFERELEVAKNNLSKAEISLKSALDTHGVISVDAESRAIVETIAVLRAKISAKEIERNSMQAFVTATHPDYLRTEEEIKSLRNELSRLENGRNSTGDSGSRPAGLDNIKILRDVKYYQMLYELLAKQYEIARLDEAKDPSIIQVLDPAVQPEKKVKPKRAIIVLICSIAAFFVAIIFAFILDMKQRIIHEPEKASRWAELRTLLSFKK